MIDALWCAFNNLVSRIEKLERAANQADRRLNNIVREGEVISVDPAKGTVRVKTGDLESKDVPWVQRAGAIRDWSPPTVGERVMLLSPSGEPGQGLVLPGGFSEAFGQNHNQGAQDMKTVGNASVLMKDGMIVFTVGGSTITMTPGEVKVVTPKYTVTP